MSTAVARHHLCEDCFAKLIPQPGVWPDNGEVRCCGCGRPCDNGVCIPIYPTPAGVPCGTCTEKLAKALAETQEPTEAAASTEATEAEPELEPEPLAA